MANMQQSGDEQHKHNKAKAEPNAISKEWEDIFQAIGHPSFILKPDHTIIAFNKAVAAIMGKSAEQLIGKKCCDLFHEKNKPPGNCPMEKLLKSGRFETVEMEMEALDRTFLVSCTPVLDNSGTLNRIIHIATDITEHKRTEEKLRESEEGFRIILENLPNGVFVHDLDGRIIHVNRTACTMTGYTEDELTSMSISDFDKEIVTRKDRENIWRKLQKGDSFLLANATHLRKDGSQYPAEIRINSIVLNKQPVMIGLVQDITERKQAEEKLRESELAFRTLFEAGAEGILVVKLKNRKFKYANPAICQMLGYTEAELTKIGIDDIHPPESMGHVIEQFELMNKGEKILAADIPCRRKDGTIFYAHIVGAKGIIDGEECNIGFFTDVTNIKNMQEKLRDNQKRLKAFASELSLAEERERRRIAMGIHDNLGQKLVMLKFRLQALQGAVSDRNMQTALNHECIVMADILDDIHSLTFELSNPVLYELGLESAVKGWLMSEIQKNAGLKCEFKSEGVQEVVDEDIKVVLFQAVRELLINIIKHARAKTVKVGIAKQYNEVEVTVEDDGAGFDVTRLGLPSGKEGGFGLFNIRERLEYIGGRLEIKSSPGKGTRVLMTAPMKKPEHGWEEVKIHEDTDSR